MIKKVAICALVAAVLTPAASAQSAQKFSATKANDYALVYTLPNTGVRVVLVGEITVKKPGEFYQYARKYLNVADPIARESRTATLRSAQLSTYGVPDPEKQYAVTFKSGTNPYIFLTDAGIPLAFNTADLPSTSLPAIPDEEEAQPTPLEKPAARQVITEEMLQSQSVAKRAELAAQEIFEIRQTRSDLISGQADNMPPDGKSLQLMLDNLQAQEEALEAMFLGTTQVSTCVTAVTLLPEDNISDRVIARLSPLEGFVATDNLSGAPVYLSLKVTNEGEMPLNDKGEPLPFPKNGMAYCIPGQAEVSVTFDGRTFADETENFAQFGVVYGLAPNSLTDKKAPRFVVFDPANGSFLKSGPVAE